MCITIIGTYKFHISFISDLDVIVCDQSKK